MEVGTRFTRVTVVGESRQVDVSLPADEPLASQLPTLLRLLSVPTPPVPVRWALSSAEAGMIPRDHSLDEAGVLDGTVLHLTPAADAALPPFVDDVEGAAAQAVTDIAPAWADASRRNGVGVLLAVVLGVALLRCLLAAGAVGWAGAAVTGMLALLVGGMIGERGGAAAALMAAPAAAVVALGLAGALGAGAGGDAGGSLGGGVSGPPGAGADSIGITPLAAAASGAWHGAALPLAAAAAGIGLLAAGMVRRWPGLRVAGMAAIVLAGVATVCVRAGLQADRTAGLVVLLAVIGVGLAGQLALGGAGLVNLMRADEDGERVPRRAVIGAVQRGQSVAGGLVWCCAVVAGIALWVLAQAPGSGAPDWIGRVLAAVGGLIFALRSRMFTRARQVLPMLLAAVLAAIGVALAMPSWSELIGDGAALLTLALLALIVAVLVATGLSSLAEVPRARMRRTLELLDALLVLALIPLLVLLFAAVPAVQRWLG